MTAVFFIRTTLVFGVLFWSAVIVRIAIEFSNAARQPQGDAVVADRAARNALGRTFLITGIAGFWLAFHLTGLAMPGPGRVYVVVVSSSYGRASRSASGPCRLSGASSPSS